MIFLFLQIITNYYSHLVALVMDSDHDNPLFRAPVKDPKHILDLGTGLGNWPMYVESKKHLLYSQRTTTHPLLAM